MALVPLRLGPLTAKGFHVLRSGVRWLCRDGHGCRPGEIIAFCNIALTPAARDERNSSAAQPFADEIRDLQVAFAATARGRLRKSAASSRGGFLDLQPDHQFWTPDFVIGHLETASNEDAVTDSAESQLQLLMLAGRRTTELAEVRSGLLTGWHDRARAWWGGKDGERGTLLSLGICEQLGIIRGEKNAFLEFFDAAEGPAQVLFVPDDALVPCAQILTQQLHRTRADQLAIASDFVKSFAEGKVAPIGKGWIFAGALLSALQRSPLTERYPILTREGVSETGPANAVLLSLNSEAPVILRHKRLGYCISCHRFRMAETGPAVRSWLQNNFETVRRTIDEIRADYCRLIDAVRAKSDMKFLIMNMMSTSGYEDVYNYAPFDEPMGDSLASVHGKEMNLMLHDLAHERDISIVDVDAIAAELGAAAHLPDGIHASGQLQTELRSEILRILRGLGIPGFGPR
jgi:hypothetical protein